MPILYVMFVECLEQFHHLTFVDHTIVVVHYIKFINIVDYESIDKTYNNLNSKQLERQITERYFQVKCIACRYVDSPSFMKNTSIFSIYFLHFHFRTQQTKPTPNYKKHLRHKNQNKGTAQHTKQMKPRPNYKKQEKTCKTKENEYNTICPCSNSTKQNMQTRTMKNLQTSPPHIISPAMCCPLLKGKKVGWIRLKYTHN